MCLAGLFCSAHFNSVTLAFRCCSCVLHLEHLSALDLHLADGAVTGTSADRTELVDDIHTLDDLAEDGVLAVEVSGWAKSDEELAAVGVWSGLAQ